MDVIKIGKFIAEKRKEHGLTQNELAERLYVTDRAVSKWECGRSLPGEEIKMETYDKQAEENLIQMIKEKEESDKRLLNLEIVLGITGTLFLLAMLFAGILGYQYLGLPVWAMILMMVVGFVVFMVAILFCVLIEQKAGYYECKECGHRYVPTFWQVLLAPHVNRTRYMKCPHCGKRAYQKKVISK